MSGPRLVPAVLAVVGAFLAACASPGAGQGARAGFGPDVVQVAPGRFALAEVAPAGPPAVQVKLERPAEVGETGGFGLWGGAGRTMGIAVLGAAYGLFNPVMGGLLIIASPALIASGAMYDANVKRLGSLLVAFDLPGRLQGELAERLGAARPGPEESAVVIDVSVAGYGFIGPTGKGTEGMSCFTFTAGLAVKDGDRTVFSDQVIEEPFRRSLDLPPPRCASVAELAEHDSRLAREILDESTHVIASAIARRLGVTR